MGHRRVAGDSRAFRRRRCLQGRIPRREPASRRSQRVSGAGGRRSAPRIPGDALESRYRAAPNARSSMVRRRSHKRRRRRGEGFSLDYSAGVDDACCVALLTPAAQTQLTESLSPWIYDVITPADLIPWGLPVPRTIPADATVADSVKIRLLNDPTYKPSQFTPSSKLDGHPIEAVVEIAAAAGN